MAENGPGGSAEKPKKESGIATLLNSPAGVTLLGFFLTGVLGALVSFSVNAFQRWDQQQTQTLTERENEISSVNKQFVGAIVQRTFYTDAVLQAIRQSRAGSDLDAAWPRYESAYQAELAAVWQNHLNIEGHLEDDPAPTGNNGWQPFWNYLDLVIQPRYQEMDNCLREVHGAYLGAAQADRIKAAQRILEGCETRWHWDHLGKTQKASVALWDHFETCLESFTYHLDVSARIQRQVWKAGEAAAALPAPGTCDRSDPICQQAVFLVGLKDSLAEDCGPLPAGDKD
jgi:hypothetical protein